MNREHYDKLKEGIEAWNKWREDNPDIIPDLSWANLYKVNLSDADLTDANLSHADLRYAYLMEADLRDADLSYANLSRASLCDCLFQNTKISFRERIAKVNIIEEKDNE